MKNDDDILHDQNTQRLRASMGGASTVTTPQSSALVGTASDGTPVVRRRWLVGDPWTQKFYFASYQNDHDLDGDIL